MSFRVPLARPAALAAAAVVALSGHAALAATAKTPVALSVDGQRSTVRVHGGTVGDALRTARITVGSHDLLVPDAATRIGKSTTIVLTRGHELSLTVDGTVRDVWVTADSVDEAIDQLGYRGTGALISANRSRETLPLKGFSLDVRTLRTVQLLDGGKLRRVATHALTVREFLTTAGIHLRPRDTLSLLRAAPVTDNMVLKITRVRGARVGTYLTIAYTVVHRPDVNLFKGVHKVIREGQDGVLHRYYALKYVNGHLVSRTFATSVRTQLPISEVIADGTTSRPVVHHHASASSHGSTSSHGLDWAALANCESGGNPTEVSSNGEYRGLYQFSIGTWDSVGGSGDPIDASSSEQTYRAELLYNRDGRAPWPVCGKYL